MSKRILSLVLTLTLVLGSFSMAFADTAATDTALTAEEKVERLVELGFVEGFGDDDFRLEDDITRAQTANITAKAAYAGGNKDMDAIKAEIEKFNFKSGFSDVPVSNWANPYINAARQKGIIDGFPDNTFKPSRNVKFQEVVTMMVRLTLKPGEEVVGDRYPTNYITTAFEMGLLDGIEIEDYEAAADRQAVFEMLYNAVSANELGEYNVDKVIVLENNRVESIAANEIVVEVIEEVQRSGSKRRTQGDQYRITVPSKVGDVENLLGKVIDLSYDSKNVSEAVSLEVDDTYEYVSGTMELAAKKLKVANKTYTVAKSEEYEKYEGALDNRIVNTYVNNAAFSYTDAFSAYGKEKLDFGKATIKNGKVIFIDAFAFDDIAPVKEVKKDGSDVIVYNDENNGGTKRIELKDEKVISFVDGTFNKMDKDAIEELDVIHVGKDSDDNQVVVVRQDAKVDGKYEKVVERKDETVAVVDGEEYEILNSNYKRPVYSYDSEEFRRLAFNDAAGVLEGFKNEDITILQDINGNLQSIEAKIDFGEIVGLVDKVVGKEVRILESDNARNDYAATIDSDITKTTATGNTGHSNLNEFRRKDLVFLSSNKSEIEVMTDLKSDVKDVTIDKESRFVTVDEDVNSPYRAFDRTNVFVVNKDGEMFATTLEEVRNTIESGSRKATIITDAQYVSQAKPNYGYTKSNKVLNTIVFEDVALKADIEEEVVKIISITDQYDSIKVEYADGTRENYSIDKDSKAYDILAEQKVRANDIVTIGIDKTNEDIVKTIEKLNDAKAVTGKVEKVDGNVSVTINKKTYFLTEDTVDFTKQGPTIDENITLYLEEGSNDFVAVMVDGVKTDNGNQDGLSRKVTFASGNAIELDNDEIFTVNSSTLLKDSKGTTIKRGLEIVDELVVGERVTIDGNVITRVATIDEQAAKDVEKLINNIPTVTVANLDTSKALVEEVETALDGLTDVQKALVSEKALEKLQTTKDEIANLDVDKQITNVKISKIKVVNHLKVTADVKEDYDASKLEIKVNGKVIDLDSDDVIDSTVEEGVLTIVLESDSSTISNKVVVSYDGVQEASQEILILS